VKTKGIKLVRIYITFSTLPVLLKACGKINKEIKVIITILAQLSIWDIVIKTAMVHTLTYFVIGASAFYFFNYSERHASTILRSFMRQSDDPLVRAGPLFQPLRGILFGFIFYLLRDVFFLENNGWLVIWATLVVIGIISTFAPAPGSIEGFIYTKLTPNKSGIGGMVEVLIQSFLLSVITYYWVNHSELVWLNWVLGIFFMISMALPILGLLANKKTASDKSLNRLR
jgi:hypothetical protein